MDQPGFEPEADLTGLETRLARLRPAPVAIERDRMLFEAGRASAPGEARARIGYAIAAGFALVAVGLGGLLARERSERRVLEVTLATRDREAIAARPALEPSRSREVDPNSYLALTGRIALEGADLTPTKRPTSPSIGAPSNPANSTPLRVSGPGGLMDL